MLESQLKASYGPVVLRGLARYPRTDRQGGPFPRELAFNNQGGALWAAVTNWAVLAVGTNDVVTNVVGHVFVPKTPEEFQYDADGNLISDGRWLYSWDAENRLVTVVARTGAGPQQSMRFDYDAQGRRIRKRVWNNATFSGPPSLDLRFVYDGWNVMAVLGPQSSVLQSFVPRQQNLWVNSSGSGSRPSV